RVCVCLCVCVCLLLVSFFSRGVSPPLPPRVFFFLSPPGGVVCLAVWCVVVCVCVCAARFFLLQCCSSSVRARVLLSALTAVQCVCVCVCAYVCVGGGGAWGGSGEGALSFVCPCVSC